MTRVTRLAVAALALALAACRVECRGAEDCGRGERCAADGTCERLPDAVPIGQISPGSTMEVIAVYPALGEDQAPSRAPVVVLTTRVVDPATVDGQTFSMEDARGQGVPGDLDFLVEPPGFLYAPAAPLAAGASYNVRVTTGVRDGSGVALRLPVAWSFTVAR